MRGGIATPPDELRDGNRLPLALDLVAIAILGVASFFSRRGSLPSDGLWFDDSWVAAGAIHGSLTNLMTVGPAHPAFTGLLMAVNKLGSGQLQDLGAPSLAAGMLGAGLLYIALRSAGYAFSVAGLTSAALAVAPIHILYSGRIKAYALDTLWVLVLVLVVPWLAKRSWRWPLAAGWVVAAIIIGGFSGYTLVATATATIVLVLHPAGDLAVRIAALLSQGALQLFYFVIVRSRVDVTELNGMLANYYDAHMSFSWNPLKLAPEIWEHLHRVAEVFPGGSGTWLAITTLVAFCGLGVATIRALTSAEELAARLLLLLVIIAFVGSFLGQIPFGPSNSVDLSPGGRHMLWLVPAIAFGLAAVAERGRLYIGRVAALRVSFDGLALAAAATMLIAGYKPAPPAPFGGSESATKFIEASMRDGDLVIITNTSAFAHAVSSSKQLELVPTPYHQIGFAPVFEAPQIQVVGQWAVQPGFSKELRSQAQRADRVLVHITEPPIRMRNPTDGLLTSLGLSKKTYKFDWNRVEVWTR